MAMKKATEDKSSTLSIRPLKTERATFYVLGQSPLIYHRMSMKVIQELLYPARKRSQAELDVTLKHDPLTEYRESVYRFTSDKQATRLKFPSVAFKKSVMEAALRVPGATKTEVGQLIWNQWADVEVFGKPQMYMCVTRMAGIGKAPDVRTRAILPRWATKIEFEYVVPQLNMNTLGNLLAAAGLLMGIGDGRQQKGTFSFGQFSIVSDDDPDLLAVMKEGRAIQDDALENPSFWDDETESLFNWYLSEVSRRRDDAPKGGPKGGRRNGKEREERADA